MTRPALLPFLPTGVPSEVVLLAGGSGGGEVSFLVLSGAVVMIEPRLVSGGIVPEDLGWSGESFTTVPGGRKSFKSLLVLLCGAGAGAGGEDAISFFTGAGVGATGCSLICGGV